MTLSTQFLTMLSMVGMGTLFGAMFDTYQRFLNRPKRKHWIVFFNDLLFWIIQAIIIFYSLFLVNNGELRFYIFIALVCGFAAYQSLFKGVYLWLLELLISIGITIYRFLKSTILVLIFKPVVGIARITIFMILLLGRGLFTLVKFIFKVLLFIVKYVILKPFQKLFLVIWKLLPKGIKKTVEKLYNKTAGNFKGIQNYLITLTNKWKKKKE
jgi:spore cortex biosynthesis protein YabQ